MTEPVQGQGEGGDKYLANLLTKLTEDPRTRRRVLQAVKELEPNLRFPDQDVQDLREEFEAKLAEDRQKRESETIRARLEADRQRLADRYDDETIRKIETDVMQKHGIADYEVAAKVYAADLPPERPERDDTRHGATWELPSFDEYFENPMKTARANAYRTIDELRGKRR